MGGNLYWEGDSNSAQSAENFFHAPSKKNNLNFGGGFDRVEKTGLGVERKGYEKKGLRGEERRGKERGREEGEKKGEERKREEN